MTGKIKIDWLTVLAKVWLISTLTVLLAGLIAFLFYEIYVGVVLWWIPLAIGVFVITLGASMHLEIRRAELDREARDQRIRDIFQKKE